MLTMETNTSVVINIQQEKSANFRRLTRAANEKNSFQALYELKNYQPEFQAKILDPLLNRRDIPKSFVSKYKLKFNLPIFFLDKKQT